MMPHSSFWEATASSTIASHFHCVENILQLKYWFSFLTTVSFFQSGYKGGSLFAIGYFV